VIHLRVVSPPDVSGTLMPVLRSEPAVLNLTVLGSVLLLLLNVTVLTAVAIAGIPVQRAIWPRAARRAAAGGDRRLTA
jgi:hypothetical protein